MLNCVGCELYINKAVMPKKTTTQNWGDETKVHYLLTSNSEKKKSHGIRITLIESGYKVAKD